jgi:hypothetical protein|tara:strand:- start:187 stop:807 length:621 start_codon:yes stop_codon:yes gene_type:complete
MKIPRVDKRMVKKKFIKKVIILIPVIIILIFILLQLNKPKDVLSRLQSEYEEVEIRETSFLDYDSQKVFVSSDNKKILLQVVRNVKQDSSVNVIAELKNKITEADKTFTYFDPYLAKTIEYTVPDEFKPVKEKIVINNKEITYYLVNANELFSILVFSDDHIAFNGIISIYYCEEESSVYRSEIYYDKNEFDKSDALDALNSLSCG